MTVTFAGADLARNTPQIASPHSANELATSSERSPNHSIRKSITGAKRVGKMVQLVVNARCVA